MEVIAKYLAGGTIWVRAYVYNQKTDALEDPTSITLTLEDADGETKVDDLAMTKDGENTGVYDYFYNTASDSAEGWWNGEVWSTDGTGETAKKSWAEFSVEVKKGL